ncbi:MAG: dicarboxylate/amino acid:cation symporter [Rhodomicrobium sp.]
MAASQAATFTAPPGHQPFYKHLYVKVLAAIFIGVILGILSPSDPKTVPSWLQSWIVLPPGWAEAMKPFGDAFIKMIKMLIAPIIFCTVVHGIASMKNLRKVGSVGIKALIYFEVVTTLALAIGVVIANVWRPGAGMNVDVNSLNTKAVASYVTKAKAHGVLDYFLNIIPNTVVGAFTEGEILQVLFIAILFGFALFGLGERGKPLVAIIEQVEHTFFGIVGIVMKLAPLGAFGAMAFTIGKYGIGTLLSLGMLMLCFYTTCLVFIFVVLGSIAAISGFSIFKFIRYIKEELLIVLGTSSSESVLPRMMAKMKILGCEESVVGLVIPAGYSFNLDGTCIYLTMATLFLAQATNTDLTLWQQLGLLAVLLLTSKGAAGVTGSGFIVLAATLSSTGTIPVASIALILGVDRFMSEARALTNLVGNGVATVVVSKLERALDTVEMRRQLSGAAGTEAEEEPEMFVA